MFSEIMMQPKATRVCRDTSEHQIVKFTIAFGGMPELTPSRIYGTCLDPDALK